MELEVSLQAFGWWWGWELAPVGTRDVSGLLGSELELTPARDPGTHCPSSWRIPEAESGCGQGSAAEK